MSDGLTQKKGGSCGWQLYPLVLVTDRTRNTVLRKRDTARNRDFRVRSHMFLSHIGAKQNEAPKNKSFHLYRRASCQIHDRARDKEARSPDWQTKRSSSRGASRSFNTARWSCAPTRRRVSANRMDSSDSAPASSPKKLNNETLYNLERRSITIAGGTDFPTSKLRILSAEQSRRLATSSSPSPAALRLRSMRRPRSVV